MSVTSSRLPVAVQAVNRGSPDLGRELRQCLEAVDRFANAASLVLREALIQIQKGGVRSKANRSATEQEPRSNRPQVY
jgi:hypothetical protein